jgi:hypothetical protein
MRQTDDGDERMPAERLKVLLGIWRWWMRMPNLNLGHPPRSIGLASTGSQDFDGMCVAADKDLARTMDAVIEDMPIVERDAIHNAVMGTRRPLPDELHIVYARARELLRERLIARGVE